MKSRWDDIDANRYVEAARSAGHSEALGLRIYTSRIIGGDPDLVLHGGGNTSVKVTGEDGCALMHRAVGRLRPRGLRGAGRVGGCSR